MNEKNVESVRLRFTIILMEPKANKSSHFDFKLKYPYFRDGEATSKDKRIMISFKQIMYNFDEFNDEIFDL